MISYTRPPNWSKIVKVFPHAKKKGVFFAYDHLIYSPSMVAPTPDIMEHEQVHFAQQGNDPEGWWDRYLTDVKFRAEQEIPAYRRQLEFIRMVYGRRTVREAEQNIVRALSSPLYGPMMTPAEAREALDLDP